MEPPVKPPPKVNPRTVQRLIQQWVGMEYEEGEDDIDREEGEGDIDREEAGEGEDDIDWEEAGEGEEDIDWEEAGEEEEESDWEDAVSELEEEEQEGLYDDIWPNNVEDEEGEEDEDEEEEVEFFFQSLWNAALAEAERRVRFHKQNSLSDVPVFRIRIGDISDKSYNKLIERLYRRMKEVQSMSLGGTPVTPPRILDQESLHIIEIISDIEDPKGTVRCLFKEWSLYFSAFSVVPAGSTEPSQWFIFLDEILPDFIKGIRIPFSSSHGRLVNVIMGKYWWRHIFNKLLKFPLAYMESTPNEAGSVNGVQNASNEKASGSDTQRCSKEEASAGGVQRVPKRKGLLPDVQKATNQKASGNDIQRASKKKASASGSKVVLNGKASLTNVQEVPQEKASDSNLADKKTTSDSAGFQKVLNWNMLVLAEPRRIRSHLRKVKDTLKYDTFEEVEEEKEIHSWSSLSRAGFMFVLEPEKVTFFERLMVHHKYKIYNEGKNEYDPWGLFGKFGDISILKYDEAYVIPLLMKLQIAAAEVARIWRPKKKMLSEICFLLNDRSDQPLWWKHRKYKKMKDFHCYLVFILAHKEELSVQVRQAAGLVLTNDIQMKFDSLSPGCTHYIKSELLPCITTKNKAIRSTAGTTIAVLFQWIRVAGWMELFKELYQCINSQNICKNEDALDVLLKITEIGAEHLNEAVRGLPKRPIDVFIPILMKFMKSPHDNVRKLALGCVSNCIVLSPLPSSLDTSMDECLQQLSNLFNDTSSDVREKVCSTWGQLIKVHPSRSKLLMKNIIESKLEAMKDSIKEVALKACQFWCAYCDDSRPYGELKEFLPNLITTFLQNMVLTKEDSSHAVFEENLDDVYTLDLRICSAAGLTGICGVLWDDAFPVFMSLIEAKMAQMDDRAWKEREAAVASIGAIAKAHVTKPRFSQILALLIPPLDDNFSLVRCSTCRTISVCGKLIIEGLGHTTGDEQFMVFLMGLVRRTADSDRIVKEAAIAALESLQEEIKTKQLQAEVQDALQSYIQLHGQQKWEHLLSNLDPAAVQWLSRYDKET